MQSGKEDNYFRIPKPAKHIESAVKNSAFLLLGAVFGVMAIILIYHTLYQRKTAKDWSTVATSNMNIAKVYSQKLSDLNKKYASVSAALQTFLNAPIPTPKVEYINKTSAGPNLSSCTLEGNFYFCPSDNCYYNPNGSPTGECKIPPMGGF